jgi:hypothetical protein
MNKRGNALLCITNIHLVGCFTKDSNICHRIHSQSQLALLTSAHRTQVENRTPFTHVCIHQPRGNEQNIFYSLAKIFFKQQISSQALSSD